MVELTKIEKALGPYYCENCKRFVTNEGLVLNIANDTPHVGWKTKEEIGRGGVVIFREIEGGDRVYSEISLLISELSRALQMRKSPELRDKGNFNSRAAICRLLRYFEEEDPLRISVSEDQKKAIQKLIKLSAAQEIEDIPDDPEDILASDQRLQEQLFDYFRRKIETRHLFSPSEDINTPISALNEAREAYRWGLFRATLAVCRSALESSVNESLRILRAMPTNGKAYGDVLETRIDDLFRRLGTDQKKNSAHNLRILGNRALHDSESVPAEKALEGLRIAFTVIPFLVGRTRALAPN
jgi:hypothetical protein